MPFFSLHFCTDFKERKEEERGSEARTKKKIAHLQLLRILRSPSLAKDHAAKPKSRPIAAKRDGGGVGLPGTSSPRKTLAFERWMQQEIAADQSLISSDGSMPKATARLVASGNN